MRRLLVVIAVAAVATTAVAVAGSQKTNNRTFEYAVGLWGDFPYSDTQAQSGVPNLIADMNDSDIAFSIHDGDLKAGRGSTTSKTPTQCTDALYTGAGRRPEPDRGHERLGHRVLDPRRRPQGRARLENAMSESF